MPYEIIKLFIALYYLNLSKDSDIKVCKFDKSRAVAVLNSIDYFSQLDSIIYDSTKFIEINEKKKANHTL